MPAQTLARSGVDMPNDVIERYLGASLSDRNVGPFEIDSSELPRRLLVRIQTDDGLQLIAVPRDRLYSPADVCLPPLDGRGPRLITLAIAMLVLHGQVSAFAASSACRGRVLAVAWMRRSFTPQGAAEVRQAANAFLTMRQRIPAPGQAAHGNVGGDLARSADPADANETRAGNACMITRVSRRWRVTSSKCRK